jgi:hypothetical protein
VATVYTFALATAMGLAARFILPLLLPR